MNKRTTIKDVAKRAGVSVATVSNVFNGIQKVSETTRERILEIAKEMDSLAEQYQLVTEELNKRNEK